MTAYNIVNLILLKALISFLLQLAKIKIGLSRRVLAGLIAGSLFGFYLQAVFGRTELVTTETLEWTNVIASSYVNLLRMIIMPLILITMIAAVLRLGEIKSLGKIAGSIVGILVVTTMIAALVGIMLASSARVESGDMSKGAK